MSYATSAPSSRESKSEVPPTNQSEVGSTQQILDFVNEIAETMSRTVGEIKEVNARTLLLSLNAKIEAHRAGSSGAAFRVVAEEMQQLASMTNGAADQMETHTKTAIQNLQAKIDTTIRGGRLSDLALVNIDLVDRNLYERTCDVRWWATDSSLVTALQDGNEANREYASSRLGVILDAYTVYHDLVLCDNQGNVVANGRPNVYQSVQKNVSSEPWFREAERSKSGEDYGFQSAHRSPLVNNQSVLVYSCGVRQHGVSNGKLLGVLGILFNWESFAQTIVNQTPVADCERQVTRCVLCDDHGNLLADSWGKQLQDKLDIRSLEQLMNSGKGYAMIDFQGQKQCVAHAKSPGFETYRTGWHSLILQGGRQGTN